MTVGRSGGAPSSPAAERARWPWFAFAAFVGTFVPGMVFHVMNGQTVATAIPCGGVLIEGPQIA